jgi:7-carboxy-7-deazaguanine synthase
LGVDGWPGPLRTALKVVVFDNLDYLFAQAIHVRFPRVAFFLQAGNALPPRADGSDPGFSVTDALNRLRWLQEKVCADHWHAARVLPQLHCLLYGNQQAR